MRTLVVTLHYRDFGRAIVSWIEAFRQWETDDPGVRFDHVQLYGAPADLEDGHDIVTAKYREAQQLFLDGPYDTFIAIEDDMVIPLDTFTRLQAVLDGGADIAYGLYCWRHGIGSAQRWSAYTSLNEDNGRSLSQDKDEARAAFGQVVDVAGVGMGCTAIKRHVLEATPFDRRGRACNDWYLAVDAQTRGYTQRCDTGLVCGHYTREPSPRILWPDVNEDSLVRVEFI